jgi:hypothetical protein
MSGRARICLGRTNLGAYLWNAVRNELSLDLLLNWPGAYSRTFLLDEEIFF